MPSKTTQNTESEILSAFDTLMQLGDDILLPRSVAADTIVEKEEKNGETVPTSYLHRFDFGDYFISLVYTPNRSSLTAAPSVLEARICLDRSQPLFFLSPYDVIPYIESGDLLCRYFSYIESPERLRSCYRDLAESLVPYLDDFARIAANEEECHRAYDNLKGEMVRCYGENIFTPSGKGADYDEAITAYRFYHFVKWKSSYFSSVEYSEFLSGNYTATAMLASRKYLPDYIRHIAMTAASHEGERPKLVRKASASLATMVEASKNVYSLPLRIFSCLLSLPVIAVITAILYFGVAAIVGSNTVLYTALSTQGFLSSLNTLLLVALVLIRPFTTLVVRLFFRKRYAAWKPFHMMQKKNPQNPRAIRFGRTILIICAILTVLSACRGIMFTDHHITIQENFLPIGSEQINYSSVEKVVEHTKSDGSFYYEIALKNGRSISLQSYMTTKAECEYYQNTLLPLFEEKGISVSTSDETPETAEST